MGWTGFAAVGAGAALGAWLRWALALRLNTPWPRLPSMDMVPLGTLAANLLGGFLVGVAMAVFQRHPDLAPHWRLFAITGFLGGLTTFSTFSAEVVGLLARDEYAWALGTASAHLIGSLLLTALGVLAVRLVFGG